MLHEFVMPGLDPGIHGFLFVCSDVDGRDKPGHDGAESECRIVMAGRFSAARPAQPLNPFPRSLGQRPNLKISSTLSGLLLWGVRLVARALL